MSLPEGEGMDAGSEAGAQFEGSGRIEAGNFTSDPNESSPRQRIIAQAMPFRNPTLPSSTLTRGIPHQQLQAKPVAADGECLPLLLR